MPEQFSVPKLPPDPKILTKEHKLPSQLESVSPYHQYSPKDIKDTENLGTWFDPLFNPHLHEQRYKVNPDEEPFNAIYTPNPEYTNVRNITTSSLWDFVERLGRVKIAPELNRRKIGEPVYRMPSGFVPPPESAPDLPYFISRTRNHLLPVYYHLSDDPEKCGTILKKVTGDLWKLEEDLRTHLERVNKAKERILTSVQETDGRIIFRGKHLHEVVEWLHEKGF